MSNEPYDYQNSNPEPNTEAQAPTMTGAGYPASEVAYVGNNFLDILAKNREGYPFSILAFLFGPFYYVYRKMYAEAAALFGCAILLGFPLDWMHIPSYVQSLVFGLGYGFLFYNLYFKKMTKKKMELGEQNIDGLKAAGGVNVVATVICVVAYILLVVLLYAFLFSIALH